MSSTPNINQLFQTAHEDGLLSPSTMQALDVPDIGAQIQAGLGVTVDDVEASEVVLVTMMPDDSGSIRFSGNSEAVRDGHNMVLDALADAGQQESLLVHTRYLNGNVLFPYRPLDQATRMDTQNYNPNQGTPLYDQAVVLLGTVLAKSQEFADNGVPARTITLLITDGADEHSSLHTATSVRPVVEDMLRAETHIIAAMGVDDGGYTDFRKVFSDMGIRDEWILTPGNTPEEIRQAFQVFSQSAVRAGQGTAGFSRTAVGGFGA